MYCLLVVVCHSAAIFPIVAQEGQDVANKGRKYDGVTPLTDFDSSVFKSKDSFSEFFSGREWDWGKEMKCAKKAEPKKDDEPQTRMTKASGSKPEASFRDILLTKDWMPTESLGNHVDVSYSRNMFNGSDSGSELLGQGPENLSSTNI